MLSLYSSAPTRFSLLLLQEGEEYGEVGVADRGYWKGLLRDTGGGAIVRTSFGVTASRNSVSQCVANEGMVVPTPPTSPGACRRQPPPEPLHVPCHPPRYPPAAVHEFVAECAWPPQIPGNWQGRPVLAGHLRLATRSMFFDPDDLRVPIVRWAGVV